MISVIKLNPAKLAGPVEFWRRLSGEALDLRPSPKMFEMLVDGPPAQEFGGDWRERVRQAALWFRPKGPKHGDLYVLGRMAIKDPDRPNQPVRIVAAALFDTAVGGSLEKIPDYFPLWGRGHYCVLRLI